MPRHWSLVLFTLLVQSAVGNVWCILLVLILNGEQTALSNLSTQIMVTFCIVLTGLAIAMAHLGNPGGSIHAGRNYKSSWLSREIFTVNLFAGILAIIAIFSRYLPVAVNNWALLMAGISGGAVLYAMTKVYRLRTVPSWNHPGTPLNFLGSALSLGGLQSTLVFTVRQVFGYETQEPERFLYTVLSVAVAGFLLKVVAAGVTPHLPGAKDSIIKLQPFLQGCGMALWAVSTYSIGTPFLQPAILFLAAVGLVCGEVVQRSRFYDSYQRVGL